MTTHYIAGHWQDGTGTRWDSVDPAQGRTLWTGAAASAEQVDAAVRAARSAAAEWALRPLAERQAIVSAYADYLRTHAEALAACIAEEMGKPLWEARTEVTAMQGKVGLAIRAQEERAGTRSQALGAGQAVLRHRPHGVLAVYGPYNFPGHLPHGHIVPALLAGNTIVFKPSELTPGVAEWMVRGWAACDLPAGVLNLVQGGASTGQALAAHPDIDGLLFTGSARTGQILHRQFAGQTGKLLALELGGNNPLIVDQVEDVPAAVQVIVQSAFLTTGQRCTCARRLFVPAGPWGDALLAQMIETTAQIRSGAWNADPAPYIGPVISAHAADQLVQAEQQLVARGATLLLPMQRGEAATGFVSPGLVDVSALAAELPDSEDFGPLLKVLRYTDLDTAITQANATRYGLAAGYLGADEARYRSVWSRLRAGIVNWNSPTTGASGSAPFGGVGDSGNLRPSAWYAADYCAYPVASVEQPGLSLPDTLPPGLTLSRSA